MAKLDLAVARVTSDLAMARNQMHAKLQKPRETRSFAERESAHTQEWPYKKAIPMNEEGRGRTQAA